MVWTMKAPGGKPAPELTAHVERRLRFALTRFSGRIGRVNVFLTDQNGPRGGIDKTCRIVVRLRDGNWPEGGPGDERAATRPPPAA